MNTKLNHLNKNESGITALETAIILIAFVVVAAIFAFTVLSTGTFLTEKSKEASYAGLQEVRGSLALRGSMVLQNTGGNIVWHPETITPGMAETLRTLRDRGLIDHAYLAGGTALANAWRTVRRCRQRRRRPTWPTQ